MRILLTGANGFIGRYLLARLLAAGHAVVPAVRRPAETDRLLPAPASIGIDLNRDTDPAVWRPRLAGIDAVINCAGILQGRPGQSIAAIHDAAPRALFEACRAAGVRRVIQISAISAEPGAGTAYALTKHAADAALAASDLDWVILRPSLVYAEGAYGGTALFRALAAMPLAVPVVGDGRQPFRPIHVDDLAAAVLAILDRPAIRRQVIDPVGPEELELGALLLDLRRWLGLAPAPLLRVPLPLVRLVARLGDLGGGPLGTTALRQLAFGNSGALEPFVAATGVRPRRWRDALLARPAQPQDRWHARLTLLRPVLRLALAALWLGSGLVGLLQPSAATAVTLSGLGFGPTAAGVVAMLACAADLAIGARAGGRPLARSQAPVAGGPAGAAGYSLVLTRRCSGPIRSGPC
ncbi:MAG: NAD(P)H-binding protein [Dongiaceae bacterium]